jgi:hypothetical protein
MKHIKVTPFTSQDVGIIVEGEFASFAQGFLIKKLCGQRLPSTTYVKWRQPEEHTKPKDGMVNYYFAYPVYQGQFYVHLFGRPAPFRRDYQVTDLNYPIKIAGAILVVELAQYNFVSSISDGRKLTFPGLQWLRKQHLPFVVAAAGFELSQIDQLRMESELEPEVPIVPGRIGEELFDFDSFHIEKVINVLLEQLETNAHE